MSKLDLQTFVLSEQKDDPREWQILWSYHIPTFGDDMASRRISGKLPEDEQGEAFILARIASCLEKTKGLGYSRLGEYNSELSIAERMSWISRLPPSWVMELAKQVSEESDVTLEEE